MSFSFGERKRFEWPSLDLRRFEISVHHNKIKLFVNYNKKESLCHGLSPDPPIYLLQIFISAFSILAIEHDHH
jgi:hypothetical protein